MKAAFLALLVGAILGHVAAQNPTTLGLLGSGDLTTSDQGGPYNIPDVQAATVQAAIYAKQSGPYTDADILNFLVNTECLEAIFDTYAVFGENIPADLLAGGGPVTGGRRANLSNEVQAWFKEVALDEQGHVRFIREVLGDRAVPCPAVNLTGGFHEFFSAALNQTNNSTTATFDPFANDVNFLLSTFALEETGATGDQGSVLLVTNPGVQAGIGGLAGGAAYQSAIDRHLLWQRRNETVQPFGLPVWRVVQAISDLRDRFDGPLNVDQGLFNTDPSYIRVPTDQINLVPTDVRGLTFARTPQQVLNIVTLGAGKGGFLPNGPNGNITSPAGYDNQAYGYGGYPNNTFTTQTLTQAGNQDRVGQGVIIPSPPPSNISNEASGAQYSAAFQAPSEAPFAAPFPANQAPEGSPSVAAGGRR